MVVKDRTAAGVVGGLFIVATVTNVVGTTLSRSLLDEADYLTAVAAHADRVAAGALLELVAAGASAGIAIALYPVLKGWGQRSALGSVVFRGAEAVLYMVAAVALLAVLTLSQQLTSTPTADVSSRTVGDALLDVRQEAALAAVFAFCAGGLLYSALFWRSRLVPRWLTGWGVVALFLLLLACLLALFAQKDVTTYAILAMPIGLQEMVLAVWLIVRGFTRSAPPPSSTPAREMVGVGS